jgi:hypothetical protein
MKTNLLSILILSIVLLTSCNNTSKKALNYKFENQQRFLECNSSDSLLVNEAFYEFESNLNAEFNKSKETRSKIYAYMINTLVAKNFNPKEIASPHSLEIANALNKSKVFNNGTFDFDSEIATCLFNSISNDDLKTSLNALKQTNSLRDNIVLLTFKNETRHFYTDKSLATILALRYYYPLLINLEEKDLVSKLDVTPQNENINFNNTPVAKPQIKAEQPGHEGHNH